MRVEHDDDDEGFSPPRVRGPEGHGILNREVLGRWRLSPPTAPLLAPPHNTVEVLGGMMVTMMRRASALPRVRDPEGHGILNREVGISQAAQQGRWWAPSPPAASPKVFELIVLIIFARTFGPILIS
jgi:hypothetical protein